MVCLSLNAIFSVAHELEETGLLAPHTIKIDFLHIETSGHCPSCPTDNHPSTDHGHFSCDHHHIDTSLATQAVYCYPSIALTILNVEPFQFIPQVYLDKFTPPPNLA